MRRQLRRHHREYGNTCGGEYLRGRGAREHPANMAFIQLRATHRHAAIRGIHQLRDELLEFHRHKVITRVRRMHDQEHRLIRFARVKHLMPHARRHRAKRTGLQFKHAMAMLAFVTDFKQPLYADKKVIYAGMQMTRHARAGCYAKHSRLHGAVFMYHPLLATGAARGEIDLSQVVNGNDGLLPHGVLPEQS